MALIKLVFILYIKSYSFENLMLSRQKLVQILRINLHNRYYNKILKKIILGKSYCFWNKKNMQVKEFTPDIVS